MLESYVIDIADLTHWLLAFKPGESVGWTGAAVCCPLKNYLVSKNKFIRSVRPYGSGELVNVFTVDGIRKTLIDTDGSKEKIYLLVREIDLLGGVYSVKITAKDVLSKLRKVYPELA